MDRLASDEAQWLEIISHQLTDIGVAIKALAVRPSNGGPVAYAIPGVPVSRETPRPVAWCDTPDCDLPIHVGPHAAKPAPLRRTADDACCPMPHPDGGPCVVVDAANYAQRAAGIGYWVCSAHGFFRAPAGPDSPPCPFSPPGPDPQLSERDRNDE